MALRKNYTKFSPVTRDAKETMRNARLSFGYPMNEAAQKLGISRKQLEDIETQRDYGCHLDLEILCRMASLYKTTIDKLVSVRTMKPTDLYYSRPKTKSRPKIKKK
jgi:transcriptional regulator with XRE-family HTH domain